MASLPQDLPAGAAAPATSPRLVDWDYWHAAPPPSGAFLTRGNAADGYPRALTPLSQDLVLTYEERAVREFYVRGLGAFREGELERPLMRALYGLVYLDVDEMGDLGDRMPGSSRRDLFQQLFGLKADPAVPDEPGPGRLAELVATARLAPRILRLTRRLPRLIDDAIAAVAAARPPGDPAALDEAACLAWLRRLDELQVRCWYTLPVGAALGAAYYGMVAAKLRALAGEDGAALVNRLHVGIGGNQSAEAGVAVRRLAALAREDPAAAAALTGPAPAEAVAALDGVWRAELDATLAAVGHRADAELDLVNPRWREDPSPLLHAVAAELRRGPAEHGPDPAAIRREAEDELDALLGRGGRGVRSALARSRRMMPLRENGKIPIVRLFDEYRRLTGRAGELLTARGALPEPDAVHQLTHAELHEVLAGRDGPGAALLEHRMGEHRRCLALDLPEVVLATPDGGVHAVDAAFYAERGVLAPAEADPGTTELDGIAASAGVVTATARVMHTPDDEFDAGDVLIAATVDPGWTPVLACAGAIVLDSGGEMSHGAVVARELGVPCVANVKHGVAVIPPGSTVEVDGSRGTVRVVSG